MNKKYLFFALTALMTFMCASCASEDGLTLSDGKTLRPYRSNINASSSLINVTGSSSRAIDGQFDRAGLYTMKEDGTIEAVAIVFTEDKDGNREEHPETLTVKPSEIISVGKNFVVMWGCQYYDKDDEIFHMAIQHKVDHSQDVGIENINRILVLNRRTNKLYALDSEYNVFTEMAKIGWTKGEFLFVEESENRMLLVQNEYYSHGIKGSNVYRITFSGNDAVAELINNGSKGFAWFDYDFNKAYVVSKPDGTVYSQPCIPHMTLSLSVLYPNKGYDVIDRDCILTDNEILGVNIADDGELSLSRLNISQGSTTTETPIPGSVKLQHYEHILGYCYDSNNIVLNYADNYITYNRATEALSTLNITDKMQLSPVRMFNGRCWEIQTKGSMLDKIVWLNPSTLESGHLEANVPGMDVDRISEDYLNGVIVVYGILRSDGSNCAVTVDLKTGKSEVAVTAPVGLRIELAPLN